jgi:hypothetical protein
MALANVACALAGQRQRRSVLLIDWDLEAPGIHEYFREPSGGPHTPAGAEVDTPGLIELFADLSTSQLRGDEPVEAYSEAETRELVYGVKLSDYIVDTHIRNVRIMKAGRFDQSYHSRVNSFDWQLFYDNHPSAFTYFAARLSEQYDYVLIDSRTGETDISGICTRLLPSKLVVVFVPNRQSLTGAVKIVERATNYRKRSDDVRPLVVYPLVSRVDFTAEKVLRESWRFGDDDHGIPGYQPTFEGLYKRIYRLEECSLDNYFNDVLVQHLPFYSYGERIAVIEEHGKDRLSLSRSYEGFAARLSSTENPWDEYPAYDLRLLPRLHDLQSVPEIGRNLVIVATVRGLLHLRVFDSNGVAVVDIDEPTLAEKQAEIAELKNKLDGLWPPHELTGSDKDRVLSALTTVFGDRLFSPFFADVETIKRQAIADTSSPSVWRRLAAALHYGARSIGASGIYGVASGIVAYVLLNLLGFGGSFFGLRSEFLLVSLTVIFVAVFHFLSASYWSVERRVRAIKRFRDAGLISEAQYSKLTSSLLEQYLRRN